MSKLVDLTGQQFGRLVVISRHLENDNSGKPFWACQCNCVDRNIVLALAANLNLEEKFLKTL